jgi:hypothetical protein
MKTITQPDEHTFIEALTKLYKGECIGIRPGNNVGYVELFQPHYYHPDRKDYLLRWNDRNRKDSDPNDSQIRVQQILEDKWYLVVVDYRSLIK